MRLLLLVLGYMVLAFGIGLGIGLVATSPVHASDDLRAQAEDVSWMVHKTQTAQYTWCGSDGHPCTQTERWQRQDLLAKLMPKVARAFAPVDSTVENAARDAIQEYFTISTSGQYMSKVLSSLVWDGVRNNGDDYSYMQRAVFYGHDRAVGTLRKWCPTGLSAELKALFSVKTVWNSGVQICVTDDKAFSPPVGQFSSTELRQQSQIGKLDLGDLAVRLPRWRSDQVAKIDAIIAAHEQSTQDHCAGNASDVDVQGAINQLLYDATLTDDQRAVVSFGSQFSGDMDPDYSATDLCTLAHVTNAYFRHGWIALRQAGTGLSVSSKTTLLVQWFLSLIAHRVVHTMQNIHSDATAYLLQFDPAERYGVADRYSWPRMTVDQLLERYP